MQCSQEVCVFLLQRLFKGNQDLIITEQPHQVPPSVFGPVKPINLAPAFYEGFCSAHSSSVLLSDKECRSSSTIHLSNGMIEGRESEKPFANPYNSIRAPALEMALTTGPLLASAKK